MKLFVFIIFLLFLLLVFHNETIKGAQSGLLLWYQTLIPSLLPFILVTNALSETNSYEAAAKYIRKIIPNHTYEFMAFLIGNLCGYPIGAKIISDFVKNNYISNKDANRLLAISSQASPMFLIGYVHIHILNRQIPLPIFLFSIYFPVLIYYLCINSFLHKNSISSSISLPQKLNIQDTFLHAVQIMVIIGVYVIIFSIILCILLPFFKNTILQIILSFSEITTGLKLLSNLSIHHTLKVSLICALSSFGGLCSAFQIKGVLEYQSAHIKKYLLDKIILSAGTFIIILLYLH